MTAAGHPNEELTLIEKLLADQRELPAAARFSRRHDQHQIPAQAKYYRDLIPLSLPKKGDQYAFEVDLDKCSGCKACVTACHNLNGLDENETWRSVGALHGGTTDHPIHVHVTTACHHCVDPACLNGCPVLAYEKDSVTGIVHHLDDQCIGCQYCVLKCPYDVPQYHSKKGIVRKCDMCSSRLLTNEAPACVQACPNEAIRITVVAQAQMAAETTCTTQLVPGAPASDYTIPTTRYRTARELPVNAQASNASQLKRAPSHPPLVFMLVFTQLSVGLFCVDLLGAWIHPSSTNGLQLTSLIALLCGLFGLAASIFHLGRPLQAWRAFLGWRKSWLSREIIFFGVFAGLAVFQTASLWTGAPVPGWFRSLTAIAGLMGVFCSVMVYADTRRVCWSFHLCAGRFFGSTILLGLAASVPLSFGLGGGAPILSISVLALISACKLGWEANRLASALAGAGRDESTPLPGAVAERGSGLNDLALWPLRQSALLQAEVSRGTTIARFVCGAAGGIVLPGMLLAVSPMLSPFAAFAIAMGAFALCLTGELLERHSFFTTVVAPAMPGAISL